MLLYEKGIELIKAFHDHPDGVEKLLLGTQWLMLGYNENPLREIYDFLVSFLCVPNEAMMRQNYQRNLERIFSDECCLLAEYDHLPVRVFPVTDDYAVVFDIQGNKFMINRSGKMEWELYRVMMMDVIPDGKLEEICRKWMDMQRTEEVLHILKDAAKRNAWPKETERLLKELHEKGDDRAAYHFLCGEWFFQQGRHEEAFFHAQEAYRLRKTHPGIWGLLERLCQIFVKSVSVPEGGYVFQIACASGERVKSADLQQVSHVLPIASVNVQTAPFYLEPGERGRLFRSSCGEYLVHQRNSGEEYRYWCGAYNPSSFLGVMAERLEVFAKQGVDNAYAYSNFPFDIMRVRDAKHLFFRVPEGKACIVAVAGSEKEQKIHIKDHSAESCITLGKHEFRFVRLTEDTKMSSARKFVAAEPLLLEHSPQRKRLVLNLLLDSLPWSQMKAEGFVHVPNLVRFFSKGVIFNDAYSVAEYTYPSLATMETGLYMHRSQIFHDKVFVSLDKRCKTLSEIAKEKGYYCVNLTGDARGLYNGVLRGFSRLIVSPYLERLMHEGTQRVMDHLDAFHECDNYLFVHVSDPHPFPWNTPTALQSQVSMDWKEFALAETLNTSGTHAIHLEGNEVYQKNNLYMIQRMDQELGRLFEYIEKNYREDEYVVNAYSDHGTVIHGKDTYFLNEEECGIAFMMRGAGIPEKGMVNELVSGMDLYPIVAKELGVLPDAKDMDANLPEVFGGNRREYVISNSIFPGQTYKLGIRTQEHEFRLETDAVTRPDGTVDMGACSCHIYTRDQCHSEVLSDSLKEYFLRLAYEHTRTFSHSE